VLGITAFTAAFDVGDVTVGQQELEVGDTEVWVLPNPSGLNAHYQLPDFARLFRSLHT